MDLSNRGTIGYIAHFIVLRIFEVYLLPHPKIIVKLFLFWSAISIVMGILYLIFLRWDFPGSFLHKELYQHLKMDSPPYDTKTIVKLTNRNALLLGIWLYSFTLFLARYKEPIWVAILIGVFLILLFIVIIIGEINIRKRVETSIKEK